MTATTTDVDRTARDGETVGVPVAASTLIPLGAGVCHNSSGYAVNAADTASLKTLGVAVKSADNSSGSAGDIEVKVQWGRQYLFATESDLTQAKLGTALYWKDNNTVGVAGDVTNEVFAGFLADYQSSSTAYVLVPGMADAADFSVGPGDLTTSVVWTAASESFNLDNGAGTTIDRVILRPSSAVTIRAARIVYEDATSGTVAAGNAKIGTTVGGGEIVAATAYENSKAVGTSTAMTIVSGAVAAGTPVIVRHTGVAATAAGFAHVEIEYTID